MEPNLHTDADKYQAGMGSWSKTLAPLFVEFIGVIKEGDRVLDVGCGTGSLTFTIADTTKAATVVGIDPSTGYIEYARSHNKHSHVTFEIGDAQKLPYDNGSFDCCVSSLMIQFVSDAHTAAREMMRVTKKGGSVATCVWDNSGGMELSERFWDAAVAVDPELNELGIGVMDQQARFQSCGPPLVLRMLKQGPWLFLWSLVPLTISGAACQIARDRLNLISVVSPRIAGTY
jgi:SAM-dependent methyltransferase